MRSAADQEYEGGGMTADENRRLILGDAVLWLLDEAPEESLSKQILAFLDMYLTDAHERALFNFAPVADDDDKKVTPFRPRPL